MKVLIITPFYPHENDPSNGIFIKHQVEALKKNGHQVTVLHFWRKLPFWRQRSLYPKRNILARTEEAINLVRVSYYWPSQKIFDKWWFVYLGHVLKNEIKNLPPSDVMYAQWLLPTAAACVKIKEKINIPLVAIARGFDLCVLANRSKSMELEFKEVWEKTDRILVNGNWGLQKLQELGYKPESKSLEVVRNVRDLSGFLAYDKKSVKNEITRFVTVASLDYHKGIDVLIKAFALLQKKFPNVNLIIIGDGPQKKEFVDLSIALNVNEKVSFIGTIDQKQVSQKLFDSDIFIMPSRRDGVPNALIEAMAVGLPCVASDVGGIPELIIHNKTGLLFPSADEAALSFSLIELIKNVDFRMLLGRNARRFVTEMYDFENNLQKLENVLNSVIRSSKL